MFVSIGAFIMSLITKVYVFDSLQAVYGVPSPRSFVENIVGIIQVVFTFVPFIIGLIVLFNKKITKKAKIITLSILLCLIIIANLIALIYNNSQM